MLDGAAQTARELKNIDTKEEEELEPKVLDWKRRFDQHQANQCTYPKGQPESVPNMIGTRKISMLNGTGFRLSLTRMMHSGGCSRID